MRHLDQHAGAVAGVGLAAAGAAMIEVAQHLQPCCEDRVGLAALDVDDEADAAGVVLERRVVEALLFHVFPIPSVFKPAQFLPLHPLAPELAAATLSG